MGMLEQEQRGLRECMVERGLTIGMLKGKCFWNFQMQWDWLSVTHGSQKGFTEGDIRVRWLSDSSTMTDGQ